MDQEGKIDRFDAFWRAYPRRTAKAAAIKAWEKLEKAGRISDAWLETAIEAIRAQELARERRAAKGDRLPDWPHPATWLNQGRWEDEVEARAVPFAGVPSARACCIIGCGRVADVKRDQQWWCAWHWTKHVNLAALHGLYQNLADMGLGRPASMTGAVYAEWCREYLRENPKRVAGRDVRLPGPAGGGSS
jgi:hypothetical protein